MGEGNFMEMFQNQGTEACWNGRSYDATGLDEIKQDFLNGENWKNNHYDQYERLVVKQLSKKDVITLEDITWVQNQRLPPLPRVVEMLEDGKIDQLELCSVSA